MSVVPLTTPRPARVPPAPTASQRAVAWSVHVLTRPGRRLLARLLAWLWFDVVRFRRSLILANLARAFPDWSPARRRSTGRTSLYHLCDTVLETLHLPFLQARTLREQVVLEGEEHLERALQQGRGVLLAGQHLGNVEVMMAAMALRGPALHVIAKRFRNGPLNRLVYGIRESFGTQFIEPHGSRTAFAILHACRRNEVVAFVIDQYMRPEYGVATTFFGHPTGTAYGLALFALKTGAPVLPIHSFRAADDRLHIVLGAPIPAAEAAPGAERSDVLRETTQRYNDYIEAVVRRHPEQWMWVHRRWKPFA